MNTTARSQNIRSAGWTLVELLAVVAAIGVFASLTLPAMGSLNSTAVKTTNQRNAQGIVSLYDAGSAAGVNWAGTTRNAKVASVVAGGVPKTGVFAGKPFTMPHLSADDQAAAYRYIGMDQNGDLFYDKCGKQGN